MEIVQLPISEEASISKSLRRSRGALAIFDSTTTDRGDVMSEPIEYESLNALYQSCLDSNAHLQHELELLTDELAKRTVPEGWKQVPVDISEYEEFIEELTCLFGFTTHKATQYAWRELLSDAPKAP